MMMHSDKDYSPAMPAIFVCLSRSNATPAICQHKCSHGFGAALIASETDRRLCRRPPSFSHSRGAIKVTFACISLSRAIFRTEHVFFVVFRRLEVTRRISDVE